MTRILITGGAGFIGINLCKKLVNECNEVYSIDNYSSGNKSNHIEGVTYIEDDIRNVDNIYYKIGKYIEFDVCYHLAAQSRIQPSFGNPTETFEYNVVGTKRILEWARKNKVKVIYAGSSSKWHDPQQSPYALYKFLGEELCKLYRKVYGVHVDICRFYNVFGPGQILEGPDSAVIGRWINQIKKNETITIIGDGEQRRDFTHVNDIIDALCLVSKLDTFHEDAWELGTGKNYSINEVYNLFKNRFNYNNHKMLPDQVGNYRETLRENNDSIERLNWIPNHDLKDYIENLNI